MIPDVLGIKRENHKTETKLYFPFHGADVGDGSVISKNNSLIFMAVNEHIEIFIKHIPNLTEFLVMIITRISCFPKCFKKHCHKKNVEKNHVQGHEMGAK
jgi:hypothetical protein